MAIIEVGIQKINVRGLTRGEIKTLRQEGIPITGIEKLKDEEQEKALDRIFDMACSELDSDTITPGEALRLYLKIIEFSYTGADTKKKSESQQASSLQGGNSIAGPAEQPDSNHKGTARKSKRKNG